MLLKFSTLVENRLYSWHCWAPGTIPSNSVICPASGSSSCTCGDHYLTEIFRVLCAASSSAVLYPVNSSCLGFSRLLARSPQLLETTRLCLASLSLCHFLLGTFPRQSLGHLESSPWLFPVSGITVNLCVLYSALSAAILCIFFFLNFSCLRWSLLLHLDWKQKWGHLFLNEN